MSQHDQIKRFLGYVSGQLSAKHRTLGQMTHHHYLWPRVGGQIHRPAKVVPIDDHREGCPGVHTFAAKPGAQIKFSGEGATGGAPTIRRLMAHVGTNHVLVRMKGRNGFFTRSRGSIKDGVHGVLKG